MKARYALALAIHSLLSPMVVNAFDPTYPAFYFQPQDKNGVDVGVSGYVGYDYRKTSLFGIQKHDQGNGKSFLSIKANSLTRTGSASNPVPIFLYGFDDSSLAYNGGADKTYAHGTSPYADYYESAIGRHVGERTPGDTAGLNINGPFSVPSTATVTIANGKLKVNNYYYCLYFNYGGFYGTTNGTTSDPLSQGDAVLPAIGTNSGGPTDIPRIRNLSLFSATMPYNPWFLSYYGWYVGSEGSTFSDYDCVGYSMPSVLAPPSSIDQDSATLALIEEALPDAEDDDAYNKCYVSAFYTGWEKSSTDWGTLMPSASTSSGTTSIGIWEGFLNLFRSTQTMPNTYTDLLFSGASTRYDQIAIERVDYQDVGDPYGGTSPSTIRGNEAIVSLRSVSGSIQPIEGIEVSTPGIYASGSYGKAYFYNPDDTLAFVSPVYPAEISGNPYLVAYNPTKGTVRTTKVVWRGFSSIVFNSIRPVKGTTTENKTYCQSNAVKCSFRAYDGRNDYFCADTAEFLIDPFSITVSYACTQSTAGTCKPTIFTGSFLGSEGIKTSYVVGGQGAYYVNASGSLQYDPERRKIGGYVGDSQGFACDTSELAWYEIPGKYWDCAWNKGTKSATESINAPTKFANDAENAIGSGSQNSSSFRNLFRTTPGENEGSGTVAVQWAESKSFQDMPSGLGKFFLTSFMVVMGMLVLGFVSMLIFYKR